jgi:hypothetical protein
MKGILESVAARAATGWQRAGSKFDFEVFAMPGGSVMAPALWAYSMVVSVLKRREPNTANKQSTLDAPSEAKRASSVGLTDAAASLSCAWPRCHCT